MPTEALLDVNVLIAAVFADHISHVQSRTMVQQLHRFHTTPTTQGGFLRFATRPWKDTGQRQFPPRMKMADGIQTLLGLTTSQGHVFTPDDLEYTMLPPRLLTGHRQWTDAYLLHLARKHRLTLVTLDARMASLDNPASPALYVLQ